VGVSVLVGVSVAVDVLVGVAVGVDVLVDVSVGVLVGARVRIGWRSTVITTPVAPAPTSSALVCNCDAGLALTRAATSGDTPRPTAVPRIRHSTMTPRSKT